VNHRKRVESVGTVSKPRGVVTSGQAQEEPVAGLGGTRHRDGVNLSQALMWNVGTCRLDAKGETQVADPRG
jgi:hypothetical protein